MRAAPGEERPITAEGYAALLARRDALVAERAALAAGDARLRELEHRLALAVAAIESVRVVEETKSDGRARFGSTVTLAFDDGRRQRVRLVGPDEAGAPGTLSVAAPIARVVLGLREGESAEVELPRGVITVTLVEVSSAI